jgi:hypothetical protein
MARVLCLAAAVLTVSVGGCGPAAPPVVEAEGTLTGPDGKPMPNVLVQFIPDQGGGKLIGANGVTDASGKFVLTADDGRPGAVVGPHKVILIDNNLSTEGEPTAGGKRVVNRVPRLYAAPNTTPLQVTVEAGKKTYDLNLDRR